MPILKPFVPSHHVPWESAPHRAPLKISCTGDFRDAGLNAEMRRFHFRDVVPTILYAASAATVIMAMLAGSVLGNPLTAFDVYRYSVMLVAFAGATVADAVAFYKMSAQKRTTSVVRAVVGVVYTFGYALYTVSWPMAEIVSCGEYRGALESNDTAVVAAAAAKRQRFCIDTILPWPAATAYCTICAVRVYPQHVLPILAVQLVLYAASSAVRPEPGSYGVVGPYDVNTGALVVNLLAQCALFVVACVFSVRLHETQRGRFVAAAGAETARRRAIAEMNHVDDLLRRALPSSVLRCVVEFGGEVQDAGESVAVLLSDIRGFSRWTEGRSGQITIAVLHEFVSAVDELLESAEEGVEKTAVLGDVYAVAAGLPEKHDCHASAVCRFGRRMQELATSLAQPVLGLGGSDDEAPSPAATKYRDATGISNNVFASSEHATVAEPSGSRLTDGWASGALSLRVGIDCGSAWGSILGTQRLNYQVYGPAHDGAEQALRFSPTGGGLCITGNTRRRLALEASLFGAAEDSTALFGTAADVDAAVTLLGDADGGAMLFFSLQTTPGLSGLLQVALARGVLAREILRGSESVRTVTAMPSSAGNALGTWTSARVQQQQALLEQRVAFVLQRVHRGAGDRTPADHGLASLAQYGDFGAVFDVTRGAQDEDQDDEDDEDFGEASRLQPQHAVAEGEPRMSPALPRDRSEGSEIAAMASSGAFRQRANDPEDTPAVNICEPDPTVTDAAAAAGAPLASRLSVFEDLDRGPFARASSLPLVYCFACAAEEERFMEFARQASYRLRRDLRAATILLALVLFGCRVGIEDPSSMSTPRWAPSWLALDTLWPVVSAFFLGLAALLATLNTVLLFKLRHLVVDTPLSYLTFWALSAGVLCSYGVHPIGNDTFYLCTVHIVLLDAVVWTLSPLRRAALYAVILFAACAPIAQQQEGDYQTHVSTGLVGLVTIPMLSALLELLVRRAYIETRISDALAAQRDDARSARSVMLRSVVPAHVAAPLRRWLRESGNPQSAVAPLSASAFTGGAMCGDVHACVAVCILTMAALPPADSAASSRRSSRCGVDGDGADDDRPAAKMPPLTTQEGRGGTPVGMPWLVDAHRVVDALVEKCATLEKIQSAGRRVVLAGPFLAEGAPAASGSPPVSNAIADALSIVAALSRVAVDVTASVDVGSAAGAVVGGVRLSYDLTGPAVIGAQRILALLTRTRGGSAQMLPFATRRNDPSGPGCSVVGVSPPAIGALVGSPVTLESPQLPTALRGDSLWTAHRLPAPVQRPSTRSRAAAESDADVTSAAANSDGAMPIDEDAHNPPLQVSFASEPLTYGGPRDDGSARVACHVLTRLNSGER